MQNNAGIDLVQNALVPLRQRLVGHPLYAVIETLPDFRLFMQHHVFAVWDFMSLLKALQVRLTCVAAPWVPAGDRRARRLINEIVLEEESDEDGRGGYISHFELYREAMKQCGADTCSIDRLVGTVAAGNNVHDSLACIQLPKTVRDFVQTTFRIIDSGSPPALAAAFTLGREDIIPTMFLPLVDKLNRQYSGELCLFQEYLERHVKIDEERHGPMALEMLAGLCGDDPGKWQEAEAAARAALSARIVLWDGVVAAIRGTREQELQEDIRPRTVSHRQVRDFVRSSPVLRTAP